MGVRHDTPSRVGFDMDRDELPNPLIQMIDFAVRLDRDVQMGEVQMCIWLCSAKATKKMSGFRNFRLPQILLWLSNSEFLGERFFCVHV